MDADRASGDASHMTEQKPKIVLAGVDGSEHSSDAMALANTLAPVLHAEALAVFVHPFGDFERAMADEHGGEKVRELADAVHEQMRALGTPVPDRRLLLIADRSPARGLQSTAEHQGAVLITVGASQRSGLGRVFPGSTAERLMSGAPCPVAIAPSGYSRSVRPVRTIASAFDGSPESREALKWAAELAARSGSSVRIVAVHEPPVSVDPAFHGIPMVARDEALREHLGRQLEAAALDLRRAGLDVEASLGTGQAVTVLEEASHDFDLLVMGSRGYGPHRAVLLGSVSGAVVRRAACPVVVLPRGADADWSDPDSESAAGSSETR
jgi:nucleotide-binding universal stress UspA family protein